MANSITAALRILGHFWLHELTPADLNTLEALPELSHSILTSKAAELDDLAVEYQRLFGFNLPPYESVFIDPSAMLMAPATERVQTLYRQAGWQPPASTRSGAPDHLGLELLALADWQEAGLAELAAQLHREHLALWAPAFAQTLQRLKPLPFYGRLATLTVDLLLTTLPEPLDPAGNDPFPKLPPPPVYRDSGPEPPVLQQNEPLTPPTPKEEAAGEAAVRLKDIVNQLLPPRNTGLYITREDIARMAQKMAMPASMGDRFKMLETLFRQAGEFDRLPQLFDNFDGLIANAHREFEQWAADYPAWTRYAVAWQNRLATTQQKLNELAAISGEI